MIHPSTFTFLKSLKKNNNKEWFDKNRNKYNAVKENFEDFVQSILEQFSKTDTDLQELSAKDCIFRINRDIRFSKNKSPYKVNRSAYFSRGGKKSAFAGYYIHIQPDGNSFAAGGLWMPESTELKKLRQEIDYCFPEFQKILNATSFKKNFGGLARDESQMLVNVPKGYEKDNPAAAFLKMKSFVATKNFTDTEVLASGFASEVVHSFKALMPLIKFMNRAME